MRSPVPTYAILGMVTPAPRLHLPQQPSRPIGPRLPPADSPLATAGFDPTSP